MLLRTVLRAASAWMIWRWLEPRWRSTLALVAGWLTVVLLHNEYVEYVQITQSTEQLWLSYLLKWVIILSGILAWIWFSLLGTRSPKTTATSSGSKNPTPQEEQSIAVDDGFDFLRQKTTLESRGDKVLQSRMSKAKAHQPSSKPASSGKAQAPPDGGRR